jgi:hypothetical protein
MATSFTSQITPHSIINDGEEMIDFLAFGGYTVKKKE